MAYKEDFNYDMDQIARDMKKIESLLNERDKEQDERDKRIHKFFERRW